MQQLLSWVGSKWKDRFKIEDFMQGAGSFDRFIEPFCGSASIFFYLNPKNAWINDVNKDLMEFYRTLRLGYKPIMQHLIKHHIDEQQGKISYSQFQRLKKEWEPKDEYERAAKFFLINRSSYYGKLDSFGGIYYDWYSKEEKLSHMYSTRLACARLFEASTILEDTEITCVDFMKVFNGVRKEDFLFLDPPYHDDEMFSDNKSCYGVEFIDEHIKLADCLKNCEAKWLLIVNESEHIYNLYNNWANISPVRWQHKRNRLADEIKKEFYITNYDVGWFAEVYKTVRKI